MKLRFAASTTGETAPARVDRAARTIFGTSLIQTGEALGHDLLVDEIMLQQTAAAVNATGEAGLKSRFTHPGMCSDSMGRMLGRITNARVVGDKTVGDLHLGEHASKTPDGDLADYVMTLAEEDPAAFGLSIAFDGEAVWKLSDNSEVLVTYDGETGKRMPRPPTSIAPAPFARITKLRAADAVDEPAANRDGLFSAAFANTTNLDAAQAFADLDALRDRMGLSTERANEFLSRYLAARTPRPKDTRMDAIKFAALIDANPDHAAMLGKAFAAGKTEDQIQVQLADAKTSATTAKLTADLAVATAAQVKLAADLTAEKTAHQATADKLNKLSALVPTNVDPGGLPISTQPAPTDAALQAEWSAFSADKKSEFLSDFATFKHYATHDRGQAKPAAQE